jgi:hypothetical protein
MISWPEPSPAKKGGGGEGDRTLDLRIANATLSQLSYSPEKGPGILAAKASEAKVSRQAAPNLR